MRRSRLETAESREKIIAAATRLFRLRGAESVSVADVMSAAGMTHGGFYSHFASKEALLAAATERAFADKLDFLREAANVKSYVEGYLSLGHVQDLSDGCPIAGLALDAERASEPVRSAMREGAGATIDVFAAALDPHADAPRRDAIVALSTMIGALVLARAAGTRKLQREIIDAARGSDALERILN